MLKFRVFGLALLSFANFSCTASAEENNQPLMEFASANCFFWYFKENDIPTSDISKITGGIVEMSSYSADKFQRVALLVKSYSPQIKTKQKVDLQLAKCFFLEKDPSFIKQIQKIIES
ncbi:hypothetical protein PspMM1_26490 [Pseudoalteromonas sp. MM1]|uniref:hypothetical protein n=1 Tax=Pseudoalteromonas sp. MM1 TaxID=3036714 RepID=UPI0025732A8B|nr:hypothetical protein [Pseudoalteromonas sp. MM1]BED90181.1 hypothetical protein PspMM1_26490 [Pseudoalteromonas sp. MM1]